MFKTSYSSLFSLFKCFFRENKCAPEKSRFIDKELIRVAKWQWNAKY